MRHVSFTKFFARNAWAMRFCAVQSRSLHTLALPCSVSYVLLSLCRTSPPLLCTAGSRKPVNPLRLHPGGSHALQTRKRCVHSGRGKEASVPFVIHPVSRQCSDCLSRLRAIDIHPVFCACTCALHTTVPGYQSSQFAADHLAVHENSPIIKPVHAWQIPGMKEDAWLCPSQQVPQSATPSPGLFPPEHVQSGKEVRLFATCWPFFSASSPAAP